MTRRRPGVVVVCAAGAVSAIALLASGLWLSFNYRPRASGEDAMELFIAPDTEGGWVADLHRISAVALVLVLLVGAGWALLVLLNRSRPDPVVLGGVTVAAITTAIAYRTGGELPWNALALWAVKVDTSYEGVWGIAWDESIRFIFNGDETLPEEYRLRVVTHLIAAPAVLIAAVGTIATRARRG